MPWVAVCPPRLRRILACVPHAIVVLHAFSGSLQRMHAFVHCLLGQLPEPAFQQWLPHIRERGLAKGQKLQAQGCVAHEFQVIKIGFVLAIRRGGDGVQRPVALFGNGHALGSPGWLQQPSAMHFEALGPGRICCVDIATITRRGLVDAAFVRALATSYTCNNAPAGGMGLHRPHPRRAAPAGRHPDATGGSAVKPARAPAQARAPWPPCWPPRAKPSRAALCAWCSSARWSGRIDGIACCSLRCC